MCSIKYYGNIPSHNRRCGMVRKFEINEIFKEQKSVFFSNMLYLCVVATNLPYILTKVRNGKKELNSLFLS